MEQGFWKQSGLSLKKEKLPFHVGPRLTTIYKHYILIFDSQQDKEEDCVVFNTQNGTITYIKTGLNLFQRKYFLFRHWKNNIFIFFHQSDLIFSKKEECDANVYFLSVIEKDGQISFEVESSCTSKSLESWYQWNFAYVYHDNLYIIAHVSHSGEIPYIVKKFDLNERKWSHCQLTGGDLLNKLRNKGYCLCNYLESATFLTKVGFRGKIFFFRDYQEPKTAMYFFGGQEPKILNDNSVVALDLENMKYEKCYDKNFLKSHVHNGLRSDVVGDKIYISQDGWKEFKIYDPIKNEFLESEGLPGGGNWRIRSVENHSILYRGFSDRIDGQFQNWIEYQHFGPAQQLPHMEFIWKEKPFADITFVVQNEEIPAHRVILLKCRYFQNMFNSGMIEAKSDKINVPDISPINFKAILEYIYCDKIDLARSLALELIVLADKYFLPSLKADCENYLSENLSLANFVEVIKIVEIADSEKLEKKVVSFLTSNIETIGKEVDVKLIPPELFVKAIMDLKSSKK